MKILLFGANGQLGWELQRALAPLGELLALSHDSSGSLRADFTQADELAATVRAVAPNVIVNAAAHTAVDRCEAEPALAQAINAAAPAVLAREAAAMGAWLVHYSTDYVFDGSGQRPWREDDCTDPLNVYGQSKLDGERAIQASGCRHLLLRTSWVYAARGSNFAKTMLKLAAERDRLTVIDDQIGAPTGAELLADVTAQALRAALANPARSGLYHAVAAGETSWHAYARHVIEFARALGWPVRVPADGVAAVPSTAYPTPATRPLNSRLDARKLRETFDLHLPDWTVGVERMLRETLPAGAVSASERGHS